MAAIEAGRKFITEQQAQFWTDMQALKDRQAENARQIDAHSAQIEAHTAMIRHLTDATHSLVHRVERLSDAQMNAESRLNSVIDSVALHLERLAEVQKNTEYKLNALIDTVDKLVGRDGGRV